MRLLDKIKQAESKLKPKRFEVKPLVVDFTKYKKNRVYRKISSIKKSARRVYNYKEYIVSDDWFKFREFVLTERGRHCDICKREGLVVLHHRTYRRLGREKPKDIVVLCTECHNFIHWDGDKRIALRERSLRTREEILRRNNYPFKREYITNKIGYPTNRVSSPTSSPYLLESQTIG